MQRLRLLCGRPRAMFFQQRAGRRSKPYGPRGSQPACDVDPVPPPLRPLRPARVSGKTTGMRQEDCGDAIKKLLDGKCGDGQPRIGGLARSIGLGLPAVRPGCRLRGASLRGAGFWDDAGVLRVPPVVLRSRLGRLLPAQGVPQAMRRRDRRCGAALRRLPARGSRAEGSRERARPFGRAASRDRGAGRSEARPWRDFAAQAVALAGRVCRGKSREFAYRDIALSADTSNTCLPGGRDTPVSRFRIKIMVRHGPSCPDLFFLRAYLFSPALLILSSSSFASGRMEKGLVDFSADSSNCRASSFRSRSTEIRAM